MSIDQDETYNIPNHEVVSSFFENCYSRNSGMSNKKSHRPDLDFEIVKKFVKSMPTVEMPIETELYHKSNNRFWRYPNWHPKYIQKQRVCAIGWWFYLILFLMIKRKM